MVRRIGEPLRRPVHADHVPSGGGADHPRALCDRGRGRAADAGHRCGPRRLAGLDGLHGRLVAAVALQALPIIPARPIGYVPSHPRANEFLSSASSPAIDDIVRGAREQFQPRPGPSKAKYTWDCICVYGMTTTRPSSSTPARRTPGALIASFTDGGRCLITASRTRASSWHASTYATGTTEPPLPTSRNRKKLVRMLFASYSAITCSTRP